ncbi:SusC/RagA family TonB-linked outer membrane protein [Daejeonella lutea]|uniref:TonB-linked outer membrane protein, SusC/RagA family n=1 Tax=Daejeonella lutea TaxID=572036 RepID=A0A1T5ACR3_9SPHI|nr:TonB-dependent receptor [Daejeonella lutea]SKB32801.1 TonB-linked outer membrane protein, SusC/RagA family [Daejeonella lutea]
MKRILTLFLFIFCVLQSPVIAWAQDMQVSGKVTSKSDGLPLPGVTVTVEGTNIGTSTGATGTFTISVPKLGSVLTFKQIGMLTQTYTIQDRSDINVSMVESNSALEEIVVVGYGTQKKSVVTGSISSVNAAQLENMPVMRIEQALQGRTSGLTIAAASGQPGSSATVRLRGFTTFGGNNNPLWVVDGVVVDNGGIGYLNQSDIESIEVLKDAASAAIYGARAAAGVILITTKKGKTGTMQVNYNGFFGTSAPAVKLDLLNATEYASLRNEAAVNDGKPLVYTNPASFGEGTDWQAQIFNKSAARQNHEFSVSGGGERSSFYSSFGYNEQEGIVATDISKWSRANVRLNSQHKLSKWFTLGQNLGYSTSKSYGIGNTNSEFGGPLSSAINLDPITPLVITDPAVASAAPYNRAGIMRDAAGNPYGISSTVAQEMTNPLAYIQTRLGNNSWDHNIIGNVFAEASPIKGLMIRSSLGTKLAFWGNNAYNPIYYLNSSSSNTRTQFSRGLNWMRTFNITNTAAYTRSFSDHNFTILVGQESASDGFSENVSTNFFDIPATDYESATLRYKTVAANRTTDGSEGTDHKIFSLFSRLNYNYKERYLASALVRRDGSSRFGPGNQYGIFPSFTLGWVPTMETFWPENKVVNFLKVRGSYGVTGSDGIGDFAYVPLVGSGRNYSFGNANVINIGWSPAAAANPDLKWEETAQTNIGIDAAIFGDFNITADWYKKVTTGILQNPPVPGYLGSGSPAANIADMENTGFEFELGYKKKLGDFNLGLAANSSFNKNKITKLSTGVSFITSNAASFQTLGSITRTQVGRSYNEFYGHEKIGIFQTQAEIDSYVGPGGGKLQPNAKPGDIKFANLNGDNIVDVNDRTFIGNPMPKMTYGLTLNVGYKNLDLVAFGNGVAGNMIFQGLRRLDVTYANRQTKELNRWTGPGTSTTIPRISETDANKNYTNFSSIYLEKGNYFRLRTLQLGYTLPRAFSNNIKIQKARVYVMSENLFTLTKYTGYDPEIGGDTFSIDRGIYPQARSFMVGLNVGF